MPVVAGGPPNQSSRDRAVKAAAREAAREALADLARADRFDLLWCLPKRWEFKLDDDAQIQLLVECLHNLGATGSLPLDLISMNNQGIEIPSRIASGKMRNVPHALVIGQDVSLMNGRCAWAIEQLMTTDVGSPYQLHFVPLDQKPFLKPDALRKLPAEGRGEIMQHWKSIIISEYLNENSAKLEQAVDLAHQAVVQAMRLPVRLRKTRDDPLSDPDELAHAAIEALLAENQYDKMREMIREWEDRLSETAFKHVVLRMLERLDNDAKLLPEPVYSADRPFFIMSHVVHGGKPVIPNGEMLEQDIYVTNGRCAWALERLLGVTLPSFDAALVKDKSKLRAAIREAHCRVIEAMELPEKPWVKKFREE
jgi:hypothetical protein